MHRFTTATIVAALSAVLADAPVAAQSTPTPAQIDQAVAAGVTPPAGYVIGPEDVLSIIYWRDKDMTTEVVVRPDGMISMQLLNDIKAAGLTPEQLRDKVTEESKKYLEDPNVTVVVKTINSRKVFITGQVAKQGPYPLTGPMTAIQLIALAGGLGEFASGKNIMILRNEGGKQVAYKLNYKEVMAGKKLAQNLELKPGDTVVVP
jgi:polysaccharide export outer membrane protein